MKRNLLSVCVLILGGACSDPALIDKKQPIEGSPNVIEAPLVTVSANDFMPLIGDDWEGALTYLNYGSDKRSTIPVRLTVLPFAGNLVPYAIQYPGEEDANVDDSFTISNDGSKVDGQSVISRQASPDGTVEIITQVRGQDDNRSADIKTIYSISDRLFKMRKMVRFDGQDDWIERNEFILKR